MAENKKWVININNQVEKLGNMSSIESSYWSNQSIYKIPTSVTDLNKRAYLPHIVSIGPYHHGLPNLMPMEEHKRRALLHFLKRSNKPLHSFVRALAPDVHNLKDAYNQLDSRWLDDSDGDDRFLEVMILDGCFILELLHATSTQARSQNSNDQDYADNDPIFSPHGKLYIVPYLKRDMLMLENQIPLRVLHKIVAVQHDNAFQKEQLTKGILEFLSQPMVPEKGVHEFGKCLHILDVHRQSLLGEDQPSRVQKNGSCCAQLQRRTKPLRRDDIIRSAKELNEAGIQIKTSKNRSLKAISFQRGVLKLPMIVVDDALESLYLNLIAFERFHVGAGNEVTSYIFFMDNIIDNAEDVSLLHSCGVIQNAVGSDKAVANLFNSMSKDITLEPESKLDQVHKEVSEYCQQRWHRWRATLIHTYFTNPWAFLSFGAAIFLFTLTIIQTVYSVLAYICPPPQSC